MMLLITCQRQMLLELILSVVSWPAMMLPHFLT